LPKNTFAFTIYLKSGGVNQSKITQGGVVEKRLRTTAID